MTRPRVELSEHAKYRIKERRISRVQLQSCLFKGNPVGIDLHGRIVKELRIGKKKLTVIFLRTMDSFLVITAYWKD